MFGKRMRAKQQLLSLSFMFLSRSIRPVVLRCTRTFISAVPHEAAKLNIDAVQNFDKDHARLLRVVQNRVDERAKILSEVHSLPKHCRMMVLI